MVKLKKLTLGKEMKRKILYWVLSLGLVVFLLALIFGVLGRFLFQGSIDVVKGMSWLFSILGLSVMLISIHFHRKAWKQLVSKSGDPDYQPGKRDRFLLFLLGISLVVGGLLYAWTENISFLIGSLVVFAVVLRFYREGDH
jgi:hypothetical protein